MRKRKLKETLRGGVGDEAYMPGTNRRHRGGARVRAPVLGGQTEFRVFQKIRVITAIRTSGNRVRRFSHEVLQKSRRTGFIKLLLRRPRSDSQTPWLI